MMDILMYLFETYIHSDAELMVDQDELEEELLRAGFHQEEIYKALDWLEDLAALQQSDKRSAITMGASTSTRIYTDKEKRRLDVRNRGFLLFLEQVNVLTTETREMVILMVLFNVPGNENAYTLMEELLYTAETGVLH